LVEQLVSAKYYQSREAQAVFSGRRMDGWCKHGRTEVRWRPPKDTNFALHGRKCTVLKKLLATLLGLFGAPSNSAPGVLCPLCLLRYVTGIAQQAFARVPIACSNENLSEILPSNGWALGQVTCAKMAKNLPHV